MTTLTVTARGQATLTNELLQHLGVKPMNLLARAEADSHEQWAAPARPVLATTGA